MFFPPIEDYLFLTFALKDNVAVKVLCISANFERVSVEYLVFDSTEMAFKA